MNGKKGNFEINMSSMEAAKKPTLYDDPKTDNKGFSETIKDGIWKVLEFCKEDTNRVIFSLKVGLAVLLVSLLILFRAPYNVFGTNIIWSILTVAIMFEYTVGATFNKGFNRALGSLLAGVFAIGVAQFALFTGQIAQPFIIGISIFIIGTVTSFMKLWPSLAPYEYGFRVILFTYCLIIVSGYRMGNHLVVAMDRLYSIAIGGIIAVLVNILVYPIWAGEQLHMELVKSFDSLANSLEECVRKYLKDDGSEHPEFSRTVRDDFPDEPAFKKCRAILNSSAKLDSLASSAKWEPPHGRFKHLFYPWSEYVKVGAVLRYCAYEVMALHGVLHSEIQAPYKLRIAFQSDIQDATSQAAELVKSLGQDINYMKRSIHTNLSKKLHSSTERLQRAVNLHSYLLTSNFESPHDKSAKPPPKLSHAFSSNIDDISNKLAQLNENNTFDPKLNLPSQNSVNLKLPSQNSVNLNLPVQGESYHEAMRKGSKRLHSWPSIEVDAAFEEENIDFLPKMRALESTAALSLATFTTLLIEFVARLDHLVEAVDDLSKMAKFKDDAA